MSADWKASEARRCRWPWSHDWAKWRVIVVQAIHPLTPSSVTEPYNIQQRECLRCGLTQRRDMR